MDNITSNLYTCIIKSKKHKKEGMDYLYGAAGEKFIVILEQIQVKYRWSKNEIYL
jgi:hypothetical protein